jgi:CRP-like cAMP-binding protein
LITRSVELGVVETPIDFSILTGQGAPVLEFKAGEVIFDKEDSANVMYIIKSGKVEYPPRQPPSRNCIA